MWGKFRCQHGLSQGNVGAGWEKQGSRAGLWELPGELGWGLAGAGEGLLPVVPSSTPEA